MSEKVNRDSYMSIRKWLRELEDNDFFTLYELFYEIYKEQLKPDNFDDIIIFTCWDI